MLYTLDEHENEKVNKGSSINFLVKAIYKNEVTDTSKRNQTANVKFTITYLEDGEVKGDTIIINPKTGDGISKSFILLIISSVGLVTCIALDKKRKSKKLSKVSAFVLTGLLLTPIVVKAATFTYSLSLVTNVGIYDKIVVTIDDKVNEPTKQTIEYNTTLGSLPDAIKEGYTLIKWTVNNEDFDITKEIKEDILVEANYTPNNYIIKFNSSVPVGTTLDTSSVDMQDLDMTYDESKVLSKNTYKVVGYAFDSWNTKQDGTGTKYEDEEGVLNLTSEKDGEVTLYARWGATPYTVIFDKNSSEATGSMSNISKAYNETFNLPENAYERTGYNFTGWNTASNGTGIHYDDKEEVRNLDIDGEITLYAEWTKTPSSLLTGPEINTILRNMNEDASSFEKYDGIPNFDEIDGEENINSLSSYYSVYIWDDNGTIYWWSDTEDVYLSEDSSLLFDSTKFSYISLEGLKTDNVTNMMRMFSRNSNLEEVDFGDNFNTSNVENMAWMFSQASSLKNIDLGDKFDTSKVTNMQSMFNNCNSLESIDLGNKFDTSKVTNMQYMFNKCFPLESIDLGDKFDTSKVESMAWMFSEASSLKNIDLGDKFDTSKVINMQSMFNDCHSLESIDLGDKFDTSKVENMQYMFANCYILESLDLGDKFDTSNVTNMQYMFYNCNSLESIDLGDKFDTSKVENMQFMFANCDILESLDLGKKFDTSKVVNMNSMFQRNSNIKTLNLGDKFDTSNVTNMQYMFNKCFALESIDLGDKFDTSKVESMAWMFSQASSLKNIDLGDKFDTTNVTNMKSMFNNCNSLESIDLGNKFDTSNVTDIQYMFYGCSELRTIYVGNESNFDIIPASSNVFTGDTKLVGGKGTTYNSAHTSYIYARIDDPDNSKPGYFTDIADKPIEP